MKISKTQRKRVHGAWHCCSCDSIIHSATCPTCLTCKSKDMEPAIVQDLYNANRLDAKFRQYLDLVPITEEEMRKNRRESSLKYYLEWKSGKSSWHYQSKYRYYELVEIQCPICGKVQKIENRECNQCFTEFIKGLDGTVAPPNRTFFSIQDDNEDLSQKVFRCL